MQIAPQDTTDTGRCFAEGCTEKFHTEEPRTAGYNSVCGFTWYEPRKTYVSTCWAYACDEHLGEAEQTVADHLALSESPWCVSTFRYCWDGPGPNTYRSAEGIGRPEDALF